jgi:hypothetical protein
MQMAAALLLFIASAACGSDRFLGSISTAPGVPGGRAAIVPAAGADRTEMAGAWMLSSFAGGSCLMNVAGAPGAGEGTIAPDGGCPGDFFTSRKWTFERDALVIHNHAGELVARLSGVTPVRFDGQSVSGEPISLSR